MLRSPFPVGFATIGDELIDLSTSREPGSRHDVIAPALEDLIERCRVVSLPLGILPDSPSRLREAILRARDRRAEVLLLAGGVGDGIGDRTRETLQRLEAQMIIDGISLQGAPGFLFAKFQGIDVLCLSGRPLAAQAQVDLLARPALLSRLGARRSLWDWSRMDWPVSFSAPGADSSLSRPTEWAVWPAALRPSPRGETRVTAWASPSPFLLVAPGQEGWAVVPPAPDDEPHREPRAYFQPS
jgi:molybdopterin biosynthesis enzyme